MIIDKNAIIKVTNRSRGSVGYKIPDLDVHRTFFSGETKELTMGELRHLKTIPGGFKLMDKYLIIQNDDAVRELMGGEVEPEYYYTREDVIKLLSEGTLEQLEDCLDFASDGVIDLVKAIAVEIEVNSVAMRRAIFKKTGFNVDNAIAIKHDSEDDMGAEETEKPRRRTAPINAPAESKTPARRTNPPKYNVISK